MNFLPERLNWIYRWVLPWHVIFLHLPGLLIQMSNLSIYWHLSFIDIAPMTNQCLKWILSSLYCGIFLFGRNFRVWMADCQSLGWIVCRISMMNLNKGNERWTTSGGKRWLLLPFEKALREILRERKKPSYFSKCRELYEVDEVDNGKVDIFLHFLRITFTLSSQGYMVCIASISQCISSGHEDNILQYKILTIPYFLLTSSPENTQQ